MSPTMSFATGVRRPGDALFGEQLERGPKTGFATPRPRPIATHSSATESPHQPAAAPTEGSSGRALSQSRDRSPCLAYASSLWTSSSLRFRDDPLTTGFCRVRRKPIEPEVGHGYILRH